MDVQLFDNWSALVLVGSRKQGEMGAVKSKNNIIRYRDVHACLAGSGTALDPRRPLADAGLPHTDKRRRSRVVPVATAADLTTLIRHASDPGPMLDVPEQPLPWSPSRARAAHDDF